MMTNICRNTFWGRGLGRGGDAATLNPSPLRKSYDLVAVHRLERETRLYLQSCHCIFWFVATKSAFPGQGGLYKTTSEPADIFISPRHRGDGKHGSIRGGRLRWQRRRRSCWLRFDSHRQHDFWKRRHQRFRLQLRRRDFLPARMHCCPIAQRWTQAIRVSLRRPISTSGEPLSGGAARRPEFLGGRFRFTSHSIARPPKPPKPPVAENRSDDGTISRFASTRDHSATSLATANSSATSTEKPSRADEAAW
jgi:hypothetical protein